MDTTQFKSVAVDLETHERLTHWAEEECRSVGSQIRWIVKHHYPTSLKNKTTGNGTGNGIAKVYPKEDPVFYEEPEESAWVTRRPRKKSRLLLKNGHLNLVLSALHEFENEGPLSNFDLDKLINELDENQICKMTSNGFARGFIARRFAGHNHRGKYIYQITEVGRKEMKRVL